MYLRILKKDLKRGKTMNTILLLFVILSTMFAAGSVNNIFAVTNGLDYFYEKAGMPDFFAVTMDKGGENQIAEILESMDSVESWGDEPVLFMNSENISYNGEYVESKNTSLFMPFEEAQIVFFDENDRPITGVDEGCVWISGNTIKNNDIKIGDYVEISIEGFSRSYKVMGRCKDAALGSKMISMGRYIVSRKDYQEFAEREEIRGTYSGSLLYINTGDTKTLEKTLSEKDDSIIFLGDMDFAKMTYVLDMVIAGVLLIVSVCLILIALVVLRFTISFTLTQEYREIGVMKAIGIANMKIRGLYMVKYLAIAALGVSAGLGLSIPFGNMMMKSVSYSMVLGNYGGIGVNIICSAAVVAVILLFCFGCTGRVKKYTPVDAIRSGETGERFRKKSLLRLGRSHGRPAAFMAANDILSSPRRFIVVILTFVLCLSLMLILVNTVNTLKSGDMVTNLGMSKSDVYVAEEGKLMSFMIDGGREKLRGELADMEKKLADNGMPAKCACDAILKLTLKHGGSQCKSQVLIATGTSADQYVYYEGTPPQNAKEIAVTQKTAQKLGASIGDEITIRFNGGEKDYLITALFQSMNNMGEGVRLHESEDVDFSQVSGGFAFQINFTDSPDSREILERTERVKELFDGKVYTAGEYADSIMGTADILNGVTKLVTVIVIMIVMFVTVLMEYSFIIKERGEIAIMKALGFKNGSIMAAHILRFVYVQAVSTAVSLALSLPLTKLSVGPVFDMMGTSYGVKYEIVPLQIFVICPLILMAASFAASALSSFGIRRVKASEASAIE